MWEAAACGSRFSLRVAARDRFGDGFACRLCPLRLSRAACFRVLALACPFRGGGSLTPARRAFERPIAMACFAERAPCFPSRMCSISSRTNSPAWVDGDLPSLASFRARSMVSFSGILVTSQIADSARSLDGVKRPTAARMSALQGTTIGGRQTFDVWPSTSAKTSAAVVPSVTRAVQARIQRGTPVASAHGVDHESTICKSP